MGDPLVEVLSKNESEWGNNYSLSPQRRAQLALDALDVKCYQTPQKVYDIPSDEVIDSSGENGLEDETTSDDIERIETRKGSKRLVI